MFVPNVKMHASNSFEGGKVIIWKQEFWDTKKKIEDTDDGNGIASSQNVA